MIEVFVGVLILILGITIGTISKGEFHIKITTNTNQTQPTTTTQPTQEPDPFNNLAAIFDNTINEITKGGNNDAE